MTYVFKLNYEQSKFILKENTVRDTDFLFTKKFKEYPRSKFREDTLPDGNYIIATITNEQINYTYVYHVPFVFASRVTQEEVYFFLQKKKDQALIKDAKLELYGKQIPYDPGIGGFSVFKKGLPQEEINRGHVFMKVSYEGETYVYRFSLNNYDDPKPAKNYYNNYNTELNSPGYLILDKPKYKPLDTLHLKAFLTAFTKGRPIRRRTSLTISEPNQEFSYTKILKKKSPGAFTHDWCIPDTLKLDRVYDIKLRYMFRGRKMIKHSSFKLEEYELAKNIYKVEIPDPTFYAGDDISFFVSAKDMNGFPLQGTQVHYRVQLLTVLNLFKDTLRTSLEQRNNWFEADTTIEYENLVEYRIPSAKLPHANAQYQLQVTFTDPVTFEKKSFTKQFTKFAQTEKFLFYQIDDSIYVRCLYNGKDTDRIYTLLTFRGKDTVVKKKIHTPYTYHTQAFETAALILNKDSVPTRLELRYNKLEMMHVKGKRSGDSIRISFKYPFAEPIHYRIYKKNKVVKSGESTVLSFAIPDQSLDEYRLQITNNLQLGIENNFYEYTFVPEKNKLHVESTIPQQAFPGDSLAIELTVKDFKNRPRRNINVAAYAVNKAFSDELVEPVIDVPSEYRNLVSILPMNQRGVASLFNQSFTGSVLLQNNHFARFNIKKNEYYQLKYPEKEMTILEVKKQFKTPEFALYITHNRSMYSPKYILVDGQPVFISDVNKADLYSFAVSAGKHTIAFRYFDRLYTLKDQLFQSNTKYFFGFNMDSLKLKNTVLSVSDTLSPFIPSSKEKEMLYGTLLVSNTFPNDSLFILSSNLNYKKTYYGGYRINTMNIDGDTYYVQGPYEKNEIIRIKRNTKEYNLKVGIETVYHFDDVLKEFKPKNMGKIKGEFLPFREMPLTTAHFAQQLETDTLVPEPITLKMKSKPEVQKAIEEAKEDEQYFYQNYRGGNSGNYFSIWIENLSDTSFIKSFWIVNKGKFEISEYIQTIPKQIHQINRYQCEEKYDIYIFLNKNRMTVMHDVQFNSYDILYLNPAYLKTKRFVQDSIEVPLKIYAELHNTPLLPFYDTPYVSKEKLKVKGSGRNNIYLHGMITDENQSPLDHALVYVEMNGVFKYGAVTNSNGLFELLDLIPGTYQLRVYHPEYKICYYGAQLLEGGKEYELLSMLQAKEISAPSFETIQNDFRVLAYSEHPQENTLRVVLHDKQSRQALNNYQIRLYRNGELVRTIFSTGYYTDVVFPNEQDGDNSIEIVKDDYTGLKLNRIIFRSHYYYILDAFIGVQKKELLKVREFSMWMDNIPEISKEVATNNSNVYIEDKGIGNYSEIFGRVTNERDEPLDFASVSAIQHGTVMAGAKTDLNGNFKLKSLPPGVYVIKVTYLGYQAHEIKGVEIIQNGRKQINVRLSKGNGKELSTVTVSSRKKIVDESMPDSRELRSEYISKQATVNTGDMVSNLGGVYQRRSGDASISIGGDRSSSATYMVDGVMVREAPSYNYTAAAPMSSGTVMGEIDVAEFKVIGGKTKYADASLIEQAVQNKNISSIRKVFSDVGFWKPNMVTNKQGKVAFTVKLPDNIGSWKTYVVSMGTHFMHGIDSAEIKAYKPLQTILSVPSYFYQGDQLEAKLKLQNLTRDPVDILAEASVDNKSIFSKKVAIKNTYVDSMNVSAVKDSVVIQGGLIYQQRYKDFERYTVPVYSPAMVYHTSRSQLLDHDSTYTLLFDKNTKGEVLFNNYLFEKIIATVDEVNRYEYGCVEQSCSKLNALLAKRRIQYVLKQPFTQDKEIMVILSKLADMQNNDGSFGWWKRNGRSDRMTIYAMESCKRALIAGYLNNIYNSALNFLQQNWKSLSETDQVYAYYVMVQHKVNTAEQNASFKQLVVSNLTTTDKLYYYQTLRLLEQPLNEQDVYAVFLEMNNQSSRVYTDNFFYDYHADIFRAYNLFKGSVYEKQLLDLFRNKLTNGQLEQNLNTYSKVAMIDAMTQQGLADSSKPIQSTLTINDTLVIKNYPSRVAIQGTRMKVKHVGGDVFLQTSEKHEELNPEVFDSSYAVRAYFMNKNEKVNEVRAGDAVDYVIDIQAYKKGEHVMLEIPLPSGMKVENKQTHGFNQGNYVEYYKHKVVYYFEHLPMGTKQIKVTMKPVFRGSYVLPPVKISLMYYPFVFGNSGRSEIKIK